MCWTRTKCDRAEIWGWVWGGTAMRWKKGSRDCDGGSGDVAHATDK